MVAESRTAGGPGTTIRDLETTLIKAVIAHNAKGKFLVEKGGKMSPMPKLSEASPPDSMTPPTQVSEVTTSTDTAAPFPKNDSPTTQDPNASELALTAPPISAIETDDQESDSNWLLWTIVGIAVAGAGTGGAILLAPSAASTQIKVNLP